MFLNYQQHLNNREHRFGNLSAQWSAGALNIENGEDFNTGEFEEEFLGKLPGLLFVCWTEMEEVMPIDFL